MSDKVRARVVAVAARAYGVERRGPLPGAARRRARPDRRGAGAARRAAAGRRCPRLPSCPPTWCAPGRTAEPLLRLTGLAASCDDPGLRETHGGAWQGLTRAEMRRCDARPSAPGGTGRTCRPVAASAVPRSARARAVAATAAASRSRTPGDVLVVVTHGGTARATIGTLVGLPVEHWDVFGGLANCSWSVLEETRTRRLAARRAQRRHPARTRRRRRRPSWDRCGFGRVVPAAILSLAREGGRGYSSAGRALAWHARGQGFEPFSSTRWFSDGPPGCRSRSAAPLPSWPQGTAAPPGLLVMWVAEGRSPSST